MANEILLERALPSFVLVALRAYGDRRIAGSYERRTFGANALGRFALELGDRGLALNYRQAVLILCAGRCVAQGYISYSEGVAPREAAVAWVAASPRRESPVEAVRRAPEPAVVLRSAGPLVSSDRILRLRRPALAT